MTDDLIGDADLLAHKRMPSLDEQIAEVEREIAMRRNCYPRWVANGQLKQTVADRQMLRMEAVLVTLRRIRREVVG